MKFLQLKDIKRGFLDEEKYDRDLVKKKMEKKKKERRRKATAEIKLKKR